MSPAMLSMLIRMMLAQAQECMFEQITLPGIRNEFFGLLKMAQEAAKVFVKHFQTKKIHLFFSFVYFGYLIVHAHLPHFYIVD